MELITTKAKQLTSGKFKIETSGRKSRQVEPLTKEEQKLVENHLWVVYKAASVAVTMTGANTGSFTKDDIIGAGYYGLCVSVKDYEPEKGTKFSTYAYNKIKGYIKHYLRDLSRMVKPSRQAIYYSKKVQELLAEGLSEVEISEMLGISIKDVRVSRYNPNAEWKSFDVPGLNAVYVTDDSSTLEAQLIPKGFNMSLLEKLQDKEMYLLLAFYKDRSKLNSQEQHRALEILNFLAAEASKNAQV